MYGFRVTLLVVAIGAAGLMAAQYGKSYDARRTAPIDTGGGSRRTPQADIGEQPDSSAINVAPKAARRTLELSALPIADEFLQAKSRGEETAIIRVEREILEMDPTGQADEIREAALETFDEELRVHLIFALGNGTSTESKEALIEIGERYRGRFQNIQAYDAVIFNLERGLAYEDTDWLLDQVTSAETSDQKRLVLADALSQLPNAPNVEILREAQRFAVGARTRGELRRQIEILENLIGL